MLNIVLKSIGFEPDIPAGELMRAAKPRAHHVQVAKPIPLLPPKGAQGFLPLTKTHAPRQKEPPW